MPWKLYVDSRKRQPGARGDSDTSFAIALPFPISAKGKALVDTVLLPNSAYTIRAGENDKFYTDELVGQNGRIVTLPQGQYTVTELQAALQTAMNGAGKQISGTYVVTYNETTNRLVITMANAAAGDQFRVWPQKMLEENAGLWNLTRDTLYSANFPLGFVEGDVQLSGPTVTSPNAPNVQPYSQLFIRSNLGQASTESLGPNYENDIVRRIIVGNTPANSMVIDQLATEADCMKFDGSQEFSLLWFEILDHNSRVVNTHGLPVSFSIIFKEVDDPY